MCCKCSKVFVVWGDWWIYEKNCGKFWFCICGLDFKYKWLLKDYIRVFGNGYVVYGIDFCEDDEDLVFEEDGDEEVFGGFYW